MRISDWSSDVCSSDLRGAFDQLLERGLGDADALGGLDLVHRREIIGRQAGQGEAAAAGLHGDLVAGLRDGDLAAVGQGADDVEQLARRDRGLAVLGVVDGAARDHFDFEVGARQRQLPVLDLHQQVGQHGQGLASFDDVDNLAQRLEEYFALQTETHAGSFPYALASSIGYITTLVVMVFRKYGLYRKGVV